MTNKKTIKNNYGMVSRAIKPSDYAMLLEMDKKVYPTSSPVTEEIIKSWYIRNPEFGAVYENREGIVGVRVVIPLNAEGWKKLIAGNLKESETTGETLFDNSRDSEIGIHIYHIEKLSGGVRNFHTIALMDLAGIVDNLRQRNRDLKLAGLSALAVTAGGIRLAEDKLRFRERDYVCSEHILEKDGKKVVVENQGEADKKIKEGYIYLNRCKMLVLYPTEPSKVWNFLK
jgi:hypothetical protein